MHFKTYIKATRYSTNVNIAKNEQKRDFKTEEAKTKPDSTLYQALYIFLRESFKFTFCFKT